MPYIYENDPTKIGTNLQTAVAYLLSLHKNQYEWNLLGIKVIGVKEALPIPDGTYEYGDAYMIGNEIDGYEMWIYTRADEVHSEAYWFNVGAFPKPGPKGDKGDGLEQITREASNNAQYVNYNPASGITLEYRNKTLTYKDSTTGETKTQTYSDALFLPIKPGKYISINNNNDHNAVEVKVNDTALTQDYYKIDKTQESSTIPYWNGTKAGTLKATPDNVANSVAQRDANGNSYFNKLYTNRLATTTGRYANHGCLLRRIFRWTYS